MRIQWMKKSLALVLLAFTLAGCQPKKDGAVSVDNRGGMINPRGGPTGSMTGIQLRGVVQADPSYQQDFQSVVAEFLSASMDPQYLGQVSSVNQNGSGVWIGGRVQVASGSLRNVGGQTVPVNAGSLIVAVYDYWGPQQQQLPPIPPVNLRNVQGQVNGNYAELIFSDDYGQVKMSGNYDQGYFQGEMQFRNLRRFDGSPASGEAFVLGNFKIPTCEFFVCN